MVQQKLPLGKGHVEMKQLSDSYVLCESSQEHGKEAFVELVVVESAGKLFVKVLLGS
jgi:hypothetical protein